MFVADIRCRLQEVVAALDVDVLEPTEAQRLVEELTTIEHVAAAARTLAAARVAESGLWRQSGDKSEADWLARQSGETVGAARGTLSTARKLRRCAKTSDAFKKGQLSRPQAEAIAGAAEADPDAEDRLLSVASTSGLQKLRDECERVKAAKQDPAQAQERIHRSRYWRQWTDREGARMGQYRLTPEAAAVVEAAAQPFIEDAFRRARAEGRRESSEAYAADGLVGMSAAVKAGDVAAPTKPGWPRGALIVLVNLESLRRGAVEGDEVCEIPGVGPVPVSVARELFGDALLKLVIRDGTDIRTVVHLGRQPTAEQRTAIFVRDGGRCVRRTCDRKIDEIDRVVPWDETRHTTLDELAGLCAGDHDLKTYRGHTYRRTEAGWDWHAPSEQDPGP